jgi:general L-amino acid transport system substrate-binding protein
MVSFNKLIYIRERTKMFKKKLFIIVSALVLFLVACGAGQNSEAGVDKKSTLDIIKEKGKLVCGVSSGNIGFSFPDSSGQWAGLDVDFCRAVAAAVLGDDTAVEYVPLNAKERFTALQSGEIDMLSRNTTWTATRDTSLGIVFAGVNYYDGQGFMIKSSVKATKGTDLNNASFCVNAGTTTELNLADYFRANNLNYKAITFDTTDQMLRGFKEGRCDAITTDHSELTALRIQFDDPNSVKVLSEVISKEPLGPSVRQGDDQWLNVVKWSLYAMLEAEELGINSGNIDSFKGNPDVSPNIKRFVGDSDTLGENLGLANDWAYNIVFLVGNYAESFEKNLGLGSPLGIKRKGSVNANWKDGGLMYPMAFR